MTTDTFPYGETLTTHHRTMKDRTMKTETNQEIIDRVIATEKAEAITRPFEIELESIRSDFGDKIEATLTRLVPTGTPWGWYAKFDSNGYIVSVRVNGESIFDGPILRTTDRDEAATFLRHNHCFESDIMVDLATFRAGQTVSMGLDGKIR
jgi:hypothetical protein